MPARNRRDVRIRPRRFRDNPLLLRLAPVPPRLGDNRYRREKPFPDIAPDLALTASTRINKSYIQTTPQGGPHRRETVYRPLRSVSEVSFLAALSVGKYGKNGQLCLFPGTYYHVKYFTIL
jgi:hypothetical protein